MGGAWVSTYSFDDPDCTKGRIPDHFPCVGQGSTTEPAPFVVGIFNLATGILPISSTAFTLPSATTVGIT